MDVASYFEPGDPGRGYYLDLTSKATAAGTSAAALAELPATDGFRERANPVSIAQLGLGAWQLARADASWLDVVRAVADWLEQAMDAGGLVSYRFPMPHTYALQPPWYSAMAQGEVASFLVRAACALEEPRLASAARLACTALLGYGSPLVAETSAGPVLQEYPTVPPAHVLNGWISALWGLYDVAAALGDDEAGSAFASGTDALEALLPRYCILGSWSRYDLYPHPLANVASPSYHRLHIAQLGAMNKLSPRAEFVRVSTLWKQGAASTPIRLAALSRKVAFRVVRPRSNLGRRLLRGA